MCRFVAYKGEEMLMADLLLRSENSLIAQSIHALERAKPVNGDGFGVGWYPLHDDPEPGVFKSIEPAWSNQNLFEISRKIKSRCFLAHVRDATPGLPVAQLNCHPFKWAKYAFMHNGAVLGFSQHRRHYMQTLSDAAYDTIKGTSDTEFCFALFLDHLGFKEDATAEELADALSTSIAAIESTQQKIGISAGSCLNFALTDGDSLIATRIRLNSENPPETLYYAVDDKTKTTVIASEPLDKLTRDWTMIEPGSIIVSDNHNTLSIDKIG